MSTPIYLAITSNPIYNSDMGANLCVRSVYKSETTILSNLQITDKVFKNIKNVKLPFEINTTLKAYTIYVAEQFVKIDCKKLHILQVSIADNKNEYYYVMCSDDEEYLLSVATEWFEDESKNTSDEDINFMLDDLKQKGFHDFYGYTKECGFLMYYFDLETELNN